MGPKALEAASPAPILIEMIAPLLLATSLALAGPRCDAPPSFAFQGAYFRKVESAPGAWLGLEGGVRLPDVSFDLARYYRPAAEQPAWQLGPLDRPSVYLGAHADVSGGEVDAGLTWDRVYDAQGRPAFTDRALPGGVLGSDGGDPAHRFESSGPGLVPDFAFRVFWRTPSVVWANPDKASKENVYFYPRDAVWMRITQSGDDRFRLELSAGAKSFSGEFAAAGFPLPGARFKRVDSIDQFYVASDGKRLGNERLPAIDTRARAEGAVWSSVRLLSADLLDKAPVELSGENCVDVFPEDLQDRWERVFTIAPAAGGGETISIRP